MTDALASYQFEENPVRVVSIAGDPWFVATDVARVLGHQRAPDMVRHLDEDEKGVHIVHTLGGHQELTIISESGLYHAILKSRRPEAKKFRKWVTGEVLPAIRREGQYILAGHERAVELPSDHDPTRLTAAIGVVREARRLYGPKGARTVWRKLGLPSPVAEAAVDCEDELAPLIKQWLEDKDSATIEEAAAGIGIAPDELEWGTRLKIGALLTTLGWEMRHIRHAKFRGRKPGRIWFRPSSDEGDA